MKLRLAAFLSFLFAASSAFSAQTTFEQFPDTGGLIGTEIVPLSFPQGGGVYQTRRTSVNAIATFVDISLLGTANTWALGQIWSSQSTFTAAPIFTSLTGYVLANGAGVPASASPTIPMSAITGTLPAAQLPNPGASTLGGVKSSAAASHQFATGINTSGVVTYAQPAYTDISGSLAFGSITGTVAHSQIATSAVDTTQLANIAATSVLGNNGGVTGAVGTLSASSVLDMIGSTRGSILYRGASVWTALTPGTAGQLLTSNGAGADPSWAANAVLGTPFVLLATITPTSGTTASATSLAAYNEYYVTLNAVTLSGSDILIVKYSINNGGAYTTVGTTIGSAATHSGYSDLRGNTLDIVSWIQQSTGAAGTSGFFAPAGTINALQITIQGVATFTGGTIKIYGR
jgi:hypothetical protein